MNRRNPSNQILLSKSYLNVLVIVDYCRRLSDSVTYHHKRGSCAKETREILANILQMKKSEYELIDPSTSSFDSKPLDEIHEDSANVLPGSADEIPDEEDVMEDMETYEPTQEMDFEVDEVKDCVEKKKKRRNYIEFSPDYEKS